MTVDPKTFLYLDLTEEEALELRQLAVAFVLNGTIPSFEHPLIAPWLEKLTFDPNDFGGRLDCILVLTTAWPSKALLSVLRHLERELKGL